MDFPPVVPYNAEFFADYEQRFLEKLNEFGETAALEHMRTLFASRLGSAYEKTGFTKGNPKDFARCVGERDASVGLHVSFEVSDGKIVYRFHTDPFPGLRGEVEPEKLDATYMDFKVDFLLGSGWSYKTTKHIWRGDEYTEHVIEKK